MMHDALELPDGHTLHADVCIIGAGAAGITLALELDRSDTSVLLLESGGTRNERRTQTLSAGAVADERLHTPPDRFRQRRFGGTTGIWSGRCIPFDPIDFEERDYLPNSGWPIPFDAVAPFYPRANDVCEAGACEYSAEQAFTHAARPMIEGFRSAHFTTNQIERFSRPTDFGSRYAAQLRASRNVNVVLHANVTGIHLHPDGNTVETLTVRTLGGRQLTVRATQVVLATGGIEVARLLLASRDVMANGIGNAHDVVGRYYMSHVAGTIGSFTPRDRGRGVWHGYDVSHDGIYCRRRIALTAASQRAHGIGNFITRLHHPRITDPSHRTAVLSALQLGRRLIPAERGSRLYDGDRSARVTLQHVGNVLRAPWEVAAFGQHMLRRRLLADRKFPSVIVRASTGKFTLDFHVEQQPSPSSRITLLPERDALGVPRVMVDWRYTSFDVQTVREAVRLLADDIRSSGVGTFEYDPEAVELEMVRYGAYGGHHLGTARMGADPKSSVVDGDCRVHGVRNLYVAGSAVFPTSSQANPTLTIIALALRLGRHLRSMGEHGALVGASVGAGTRDEAQTWAE